AAAQRARGRLDRVDAQLRLVAEDAPEYRVAAGGDRADVDEAGFVAGRQDHRERAVRLHLGKERGPVTEKDQGALLEALAAQDDPRAALEGAGGGLDGAQVERGQVGEAARADARAARIAHHHVD